MDKRRGFLLITLFLLIGFTIVNALMVFPAGYQISEGIMYMFNYRSLYFGIAETSISGLMVLTLFGGVALSLFFLLLSLVFFIINIKKPKMTIPTLVAFGLSMVAVLLTFLSLLGLEFLANAAYIGANCIGLGQDEYLFESMYLVIQNIVRGGINMFVCVLAMPLVIVPFVTFVLSIFINGFKKKPKKDAEALKEAENAK